MIQRRNEANLTKPVEYKSCPRAKVTAIGRTGAQLPFAIDKARQKYVAVVSPLSALPLLLSLLISYAVLSWQESVALWTMLTLVPAGVFVSLWIATEIELRWNRKVIANLEKAGGPLPFNREVVGLSLSDQTWIRTAGDTSWDTGALTVHADRISYRSLQVTFDLPADRIEWVEVKGDSLGSYSTYVYWRDDLGERQVLAFQAREARFARARFHLAVDLRNRIVGAASLPLPESLPFAPLPPKSTDCTLVAPEFQTASRLAKILAGIPASVLTLGLIIVEVFLSIKFRWKHDAAFLFPLYVVGYVIWALIVPKIDRRLPEKWKSR